MLTEADDSQSFPSDAGSSRCNLADLLHALDPRALAESLVQPGGTSVEIEDVAQRRIGCLFHWSWGHVTHSYA